jgi:hypothetical protein
MTNFFLGSVSLGGLLLLLLLTLDLHVVLRTTQDAICGSWYATAIVLHAEQQSHEGSVNRAIALLPMLCSVPDYSLHATVVALAAYPDFQSQRDLASALRLAPDKRYPARWRETNRPGHCLANLQVLAHVGL